MRALKLGDRPRRFQLAKDVLSNVEADENCLRKWIFSDEAVFCIRKVNCHNCRILGSVNPYSVRELERDVFALSCYILRATKDVHVKVVDQSVVLIL